MKVTEWAGMVTVPFFICRVILYLFSSGFNTRGVLGGKDSSHRQQNA